VSYPVRSPALAAVMSTPFCFTDSDVLVPAAVVGSRNSTLAGVPWVRAKPAGWLTVRAIFSLFPCAAVSLVYYAITCSLLQREQSPFDTAAPSRL